MEHSYPIFEKVKSNEKKIDSYFERLLHIKIRHVLRTLWIVGSSMSIVGLVLYWGTSYVRVFAYFLLPLGLYGLIYILWDSIQSHGKDAK